MNTNLNSHDAALLGIEPGSVNGPTSSFSSGGTSSSLNSHDAALLGIQPSSGSEPSFSAPKTSSSDSPWYEKAWDFANTPLLTASTFGLPEDLGMGGFGRGVEHIASGLTSPLSVALTAATFGTGGLLTSAGETALKEATLEGGAAAFSAADIAQIAKGSKAALEAYHSVPDIEPLIKGTLEVGGHDLGLLQKARDFFGPVSHDMELAEPEFQKILSHAGLDPQQIKALGRGAISAEEREALAAANGGFTDAQLKELARTGNTIKNVTENAGPVRNAVEAAGADWDTYKRGRDFLHDSKMDEAALLGGDAIDRGAFQILHHVAPDLSLGTTLRAARTAKTLMNTGFTLQQLEGAAAMSPRFFDALKEGDYDKAAEYGTEWAANAVLGVAGASHALHSWGELAEPILGSKLKPSDEQLRVNNLNGVREAEHAVGDQQGIDVHKGLLREMGYDPDKISGMSKAEKVQLADDLVKLHLAIESGKDAGFADAYRTQLRRALGVDEARPVNGLPEGKPIAPTEIPPRANTEVVFQNDHGEVRVGADGTPVVRMSPEAWSEFETSVGHKFSGISYSKAQIDDVVSQLRAEHPLSGPIAELFRAAQERGMPAAVSPGSGVLVTSEELHHAFQRRRASDGEIYNHLDGATKLPNGTIQISPDSPWVRLNGIIPKGATDYMDGLGYSGDPITRVAETAAKFRAGRVPKGVTPEEAIKWLSEYENEVKAKHGPDSYEPAERINEVARQHLEDIHAAREARNNLTEQGAGPRVVGVPQAGTESVRGVVPEEPGGVRGEAPEGLKAREVEEEPHSFVSSNVYKLGNVSEATTRLGSRTQKLAENLSRDLAARLGVKADVRGVVGHWEGGAENSTISRFTPGTDPEKIEYYNAILSKVKRQNTGIHFIPDVKGSDKEFQFRVSSAVASPKEIARLLEEHHISGSSIEPIAGGHNVIIASPGGELRGAVSELANRLKANEVKEHNGIQTTLGDWDDRDAASTVYDARIRGLEAQHPEWGKIRSEFESSPEYSTLSKLVREAEEKVTAAEAEKKTASPFITGVHGSRTANITELNPEFHGKGPQKGAEVANAKRFPEGVNPPKISFLNLEGAKGEPFYERLPYQYRAVLNSENIYNWVADHDELLPKAEAEARAKKWDTIPGAVGAVYQRMMKDAGYEGYYHPGVNQIGVFKNTPVERMLAENGGLFAKEKPGPDANGVGLNEGTNHGLMPRFRVAVRGRIALPEKPLILDSTNNKNAASQISNLDKIRKLHPDPTASNENWTKMMAYAHGDKDVPMPPYAFIKELNGTGIADRLQKLTPVQIEETSHGLAQSKELYKAYTSGQLTPVTTGKLFLWSFLSRGVSPYAQESLFMDAFSGADKWIRKSAEGKFTEKDLPAYRKWAKTVAPEGEGLPGAGASHNLNAFGEDFLLKMGERRPELGGKTGIQYIHDLMSDPKMSGKQIRREFAKIGEGVGVDNKVVSFSLLVSGRHDVMVLDRVQFRNLWDDGRFNGENLYDGQKSGDKTMNGSRLGVLGDGARGLLTYEALEDGLAPKLKKVYNDLGRSEDPSVGRYHWESWVAGSDQEVAHGTLGAILADAKGDDQAIQKVSARQGKFHTYQYGTEYHVDKNNEPYFRYNSPSGEAYDFSVPAWRKLLDEIKKPGNKVVTPEFGVTMDKINNEAGNWTQDKNLFSDSKNLAEEYAKQFGNKPWYDRPEVNKQRFEYLLQNWADRAGGNGQGKLALEEAARGKNLTDGSRTNTGEVKQGSLFGNPENQTVGTAAGAKADTDFFAQAKAELGTDNISAIAKRAQERKEAARPENGLFSKEPERENLAPTWYLKSNQLIDSRMQGPMPADTALKMLENNGVKPDELKYTGLSDFLKEKGSEPVRPEELREYLAANNLQITEVTKGGPYETYGENGATRYGSYVLPGEIPGSYRELLMTLPSGGEDMSRRFAEISDEMNTPGLSPERYTELHRERMLMGERQRQQNLDNTFKSAHWDEPNVVGHVRFNDRTGPNGEKLLHLEELQSDWHQKGRKAGYTSGERKQLSPQETAEWRSLRDRFTQGRLDNAEDISRFHELDRDQTVDSFHGVPDAPFKKTWPEFLFKRMVRYAAENGYDGISWTPGEEQAARYDLSKSIDKITVNPVHDNYSTEKMVELIAHDKQGAVPIHQTIPLSRLPDYIGKEASQKLTTGGNAGKLEAGDMVRLENADLKVGGEGMKGFYDKIVPDLANKLGKQFGAKVGETEISKGAMQKLKYEGPDLSLSDVMDRIKDAATSGWNVQLRNIANAMSEGKSFREAFEIEGSEALAHDLGGKAEWFDSSDTRKVPHFPITDSLRESVLHRGQPLFSRDRPVNGLPDNLEDMLRDNEFAKRSPEYQKKILDAFDMIAENKLPERINKAYKFATAEDGKNWELAHRNGMMDEFTDNHVHRKYLKNEQGNLVVSDAKAGKFATNTTGARRRAYDTLLTALLKSPNELQFNPAEAISKDRAEVVKAAANRKFISQLMSSGLRASDGRPVAYLNGAGNVVSGENGKDPKIFVDPNRVRKINIDDKTIDHLTKSGDLQRFLDDGTIRDITPYVHPDNIGGVIDRLAKEALKSIDYTKYGEQGNNVLLSQIERLKEMQKTGDYSGLKELNDMQSKVYAWSPQGYVALDHSAMRGWNFVTNSPDGSQVLVNSDIMAHPEYAQYLKNRLGLEKGALSQNPIGKAVLGAGKVAKETLLSLSPFHLVQIGLRGIMTGVNPFTLEGPDIEHGARINPADPNSPTKLKKMVEQGMTTGRDYKSMQEYTEGLSGGSHSLLRRVPVVGPILADSMQFQTDFLFKRYLPAIKATAAEKLFDDYQAKYPEWSVDKIARAAASHANDSFGGVNWRAMGRNATTQEFARAVLLAPDWLESELRSGARLFNKDEGAIGRRQVVIMAGSVYLMARALNAMTTGNPHYEAPFSLATKSKDGKETLWGIRMLPSDLLHAASSPGEFIKGRLSPGVGLTQELLSGRDKMGRKLQPQDLWADAVHNLMPIPVQSIGQAITNTGPQVGNAGQVWKAIGGTARSYSTPAQQKAAELAATHGSDGFVDPVQQARHRAVQELGDRLRSGDIAWPDLVKMTYGTSQLTEAELKKIQNNYKVTQSMPADMAHLYSRASHLPAKEFLDVWDTANITEQKALQPLMVQTQKKYLRKAAKDLTPEQRQQDPTFQRLLHMAMGVPQQNE